MMGFLQRQFHVKFRTNFQIIQIAGTNKARTLTSGTERCPPVLTHFIDFFSLKKRFVLLLSIILEGL